MPSNDKKTEVFFDLNIFINHANVWFVVKVTITCYSDNNNNDLVSSRYPLSLLLFTVEAVTWHLTRCNVSGHQRQCPPNHFTPFNSVIATIFILFISMFLFLGSLPCFRSILVNVAKSAILTLSNHCLLSPLSHSQLGALGHRDDLSMHFCFVSSIFIRLWDYLQMLLSRLLIFLSLVSIVYSCCISIALPSVGCCGATSWAYAPPQVVGYQRVCKHLNMQGPTVLHFIQIPIYQKVLVPVPAPPPPPA